MSKAVDVENAETTGTDIKSTRNPRIKLKFIEIIFD
jgi:hypothetical protein